MIFLFTSGLDHDGHFHVEKLTAMDILQRFAQKWRSKIRGENKDPTESTQSCYICLEDISKNRKESTKIGCKHRVHKGCLQTQLDQLKRRGGQILRQYAQCGQCAIWIEGKNVKSIPQIDKLTLREVRRYYELQIPDSKSHRVFRCHLCGNLFHEQKAPCAQDTLPGKFVRCSACAHLCSEHGSEYLAYKCRYCCKVANFVCGSGNHMCNECHDIQVPKLCVGLAGGCSGNHLPNGTASECLGCTMCNSLPRRIPRSTKSNSSIVSLVSLSNSLLYR